MMFVFNVARLAFLCGLGVLVLALLVPRVSHRILTIWNVGHIQDDSDLNLIKIPIDREHPKFKGGRLNKETRSNIFSNSFNGLNTLAHDQSSKSINDILAQRRQSIDSNQNVNYQSFFSSSILNLIILGTAVLLFYSVISIMTWRIQAIKFQANPNGFQGNQNYIEQKTRIENSRLTRYQRRRQLFKKIGGNNITAAIRLIAGELNKQKDALLLSNTKDQTKKSHKCNCPCHHEVIQEQINHNYGQ